MGTWKIDTTSEPGLMKLVLEGRFEPAEITAVAEAHNKAIDSFRGRDYKVWVDLVRLVPLSQECAAIFARAKDYSSAQPNFRGSAVLVENAIVAMQHRRTSVESGVMPTELISSDPAALREHLRTVHRTR